MASWDPAPRPCASCMSASLLLKSPSSILSVLTAASSVSLPCPQPLLFWMVEGLDGFLLVLVWPLQPPRGWPDSAAGLWEMGPGTVFAKTSKLKVGCLHWGKRWPQRCLPSLWPERVIVSASSDEGHIFQTNPTACPAASSEQGRRL